nr:MAG TPA: hypothetical protein [Caudoviricetes sp.]
MIYVSISDCNASDAALSKLEGVSMVIPLSFKAG